MKMNSKFLGCLAVLSVIAILGGGCASRKINCREVLETSASHAIYTNQNFWYEDPTDISSLNYQSGEILPFGTMVEIVGATEKTVSFRPSGDGRVFTINFYPEWEMMTMEDYIRNILTVKDAAMQREGLSSPEALALAEKGKVKVGMTRADVLKAYGWPSKSRTPYMAQDTWVYWLTPIKSKRVVFKGEKVIAVLEI